MFDSQWEVEIYDIGEVKSGQNCDDDTYLIRHATQHIFVRQSQQYSVGFGIRVNSLSFWKRFEIPVSRCDSNYCWQWRPVVKTMTSL